MIQPRAVTARIGSHEEEGRRGATAIDQPRNAGRDNEDDNRKKGCDGHNGQRQRRRHAGLKRYMCQTPLAGVARGVLLKVRAMLYQQPLREQQYTRE